MIVEAADSVHIIKFFDVMSRRRTRIPRCHVTVEGGVVDCRLEVLRWLSQYQSRTVVWKQIQMKFWILNKMAIIAWVYTVYNLAVELSANKPTIYKPWRASPRNLFLQSPRPPPTLAFCLKVCKTKANLLLQKGIQIAPLIPPS